MDSNNINILLNRYESVLSAQMTKFLNTALQRLTCDLYCRFGAFLAPVSVGIITGKHYTKNSGTKLNDRSDNGNCESATKNYNKTEELSDICTRKEIS